MAEASIGPNRSVLKLRSMFSLRILRLFKLPEVPSGEKAEGRKRLWPPAGDEPRRLLVLKLLLRRFVRALLRLPVGFRRLEAPGVRLAAEKAEPGVPYVE